MRYHLDAKETFNHFQTFPKYQDINFETSSYMAFDTTEDGEVVMQWAIQLNYPQYKYSDILLRVVGNINSATTIVSLLNKEYEDVYNIWKFEYERLQREYEELDSDIDFHYYLRSFFTTPDMEENEFKQLLSDLLNP